MRSNELVRAMCYAVGARIHKSITLCGGPMLWRVCVCVIFCMYTRRMGCKYSTYTPERSTTKFFVDFVECLSRAIYDRIELKIMWETDIISRSFWDSGGLNWWLKRENMKISDFSSVILLKRTYYFEWNERTIHGFLWSQIKRTQRLAHQRICIMKITSDEKKTK